MTDSSMVERHIFQRLVEMQVRILPVTKSQTNMLVKFRILKIRIYITNMRMRIRQKRDNTTHEQRKLFFETVKDPLLKDRGCCEMCGNKELSLLQVHHVLPYADFPYLERDLRNTILLCPNCHNKIHTNPFLNSGMILRKAEELGVDVKAVYGNPPI